MKISDVELNIDLNSTTYSVRVTRENKEVKLWFTIENQHNDLLSTKNDAALVGLLIPAMFYGEDIYIEGEISEKIYFNLTHQIQRILIKIIPSLKHIKIHPEHITHEKERWSNGIITGFSGGIDSFCALADHLYSNSIESHKISHLLFNNVGSHGSGAESVFNSRYSRLLRVTNEIGIPFIKINSNLNDFYKGILGFQQTHTLRNMSAVLLLQNGIHRYMYASAYKDTDSFIGQSHDIAFTDLITLPMLSSNMLDAFSIGGEYSRVQKTLKVSDLAISYDNLDVCVKAKDAGLFTNCSKCWKCLRTLATLDISGNLEKYRNSFDLKIYQNNKKYYFKSIVNSQDPLITEVLELAQSEAFPLPSNIKSKTLFNFPFFNKSNK